ncbi:MAG TPA: MBL fold metallo-hydrolase [bacterium]|nr:MBL fold metallo-hydrolase [bacterium]
MRIKWLAHSAFLLTASDGTRIVTDPYTPGGGITFGRITEPADFVTVSHDHFDHNDVAGVPGKPAAIRSSGSHKAGGVSVTGFDTFHDDKHGAQRGRNIIFVFEDPVTLGTRSEMSDISVMSPLRVAHLGDLGHVPTEQAKVIGKVDVVLIPVGGYYTIDPAAAHQTAELLGARVVIPMHYKTGKLGLPIVGVDEFTRGRTDVKKLGTEVEVSTGSLPATPEIWVLEHAL